MRDAFGREPSGDLGRHLARKPRHEHGNLIGTAQACVDQVHMGVKVCPVQKDGSRVGSTEQDNPDMSTGLAAQR